jgi:hypothetical protein
MSHRLFIDECLSPELVDLARAAGHVESTCSRDRGMRGLPDWELITFVVTGDFTLVTHNARDFRGEGQENPGGLHAQQEIHAGLICLNSFYPMDLDRQHRLFQLALAELDGMPDLINQALEIFEDEEGTVTAELYDIPGPL